MHKTTATTYRFDASELSDIELMYKCAWCHREVSVDPTFTAECGIPLCDGSGSAHDVMNDCEGHEMDLVGVRFTVTESVSN